MCMVWGNILYAATGYLCVKWSEETFRNIPQVVRYFFAGIYFGLDIISILYFTKIVVMITTVQMMLQLIDYEKTDKVNTVTTNDTIDDTIDDTIPIALDVGSKTVISSDESNI